MSSSSSLSRKPWSSAFSARISVTTAAPAIANPGSPNPAMKPRPTVVSAAIGVVASGFDSGRAGAHNRRSSTAAQPATMAPATNCCPSCPARPASPAARPSKVKVRTPATRVPARNPRRSKPRSIPTSSPQASAVATRKRVPATIRVHAIGLDGQAESPSRTCCLSFGRSPALPQLRGVDDAIAKRAAVGARRCA